MQTMECDLKKFLRKAIKQDDYRKLETMLHEVDQQLQLELVSL